jgi:hypothetical protein
MPYFVVEQSMLGLLVQDTIGGQDNPFKVAIEFLDKTEGRWDRDNTREARGTLEELARSYASQPPAGRRWYRSKYFEEAFITPLQIAGAYGLFQATGLWGELIDYYAFVFIPDAQYESETPAFLPLSTIDGVQLPWSQWRKPPTQTNIQVEGGWLVPLQPNPYTGVSVGGGIITQLVLSGYTVYPLGQQPAALVPESPSEEEPE